MKKRCTARYITVTFQNTRDKAILKAWRDTKQITHKTERQDNNAFKIVGEKYFLHRILYPAKISSLKMKAE